MPVYEYQCEDCNRKFDVVATLTEKESGLAPVCPKCRGRHVQQIFSRFTVLTASKSESDDFGDEDLGGESDIDSDSATGDFGDYGSDEPDNLDDDLD
jgi:putative FmdB family regulatory protein